MLVQQSGCMPAPNTFLSQGRQRAGEAVVFSCNFPKVGHLKICVLFVMFPQTHTIWNLKANCG